MMFELDFVLFQGRSKAHKREFHRIHAQSGEPYIQDSAEMHRYIRKVC